MPKLETSNPELDDELQRYLETAIDWDRLDAERSLSFASWPPHAGE